MSHASFCLGAGKGWEGGWGQVSVWVFCKRTYNIEILKFRRSLSQMTKGGFCSVVVRSREVVTSGLIHECVCIVHM